MRVDDAAKLYSAQADIASANEARGKVSYGGVYEVGGRKKRDIHNYQGVKIGTEDLGEADKKSSGTVLKDTKTNRYYKRYDDGRIEWFDEGSVPTSEMYGPLSPTQQSELTDEDIRRRKGLTNVDVMLTGANSDGSITLGDGRELSKEQAQEIANNYNATSPDFMWVYSDDVKDQPYVPRWLEEIIQGKKAKWIKIPKNGSVPSTATSQSTNNSDPLGIR